MEEVEVHAREEVVVAVEFHLLKEAVVVAVMKCRVRVELL